MSTLVLTQGEQYNLLPVGEKKLNLPGGQKLKELKAGVIEQFNRLLELPKLLKQELTTLELAAFFGVPRNKINKIIEIDRMNLEKGALFEA